MERKLAAILAADVVGYSALMEADEAGTFDRLRAGRKELFEPEINKHHGRIFKLMGDGLLAEFGSVVDAVECAVALQRGMAERNASVPEDKRIEVRIGINLGEVIVEGDDRYGEGVNVAARLQQLAEPGGICVSGKVSKEVEKKLAFGFEPMGEQRVKNIAEPIACYRVNLQLAGRLNRAVCRRLHPGCAEQSRDRCSAIHQHERRSGAGVFRRRPDRRPDYRSVARCRALRHLAALRLRLQGKAIDVRPVANDLGVRYVVEGSVRRAATRVRINVQLIDANDGTHLWAERFDRDLADIFSLQDEVVGRIVSALAGAAVGAPRSKTRGRRTLKLTICLCAGGYW